MVNLPVLVKFCYNAFERTGRSLNQRDEKAAMTQDRRDGDIDFAKGLACLMMVFGHTGFYMGICVERPPCLSWTWILAESSVALFFMATGMNVIHYVRHNENKKGWGPTRTFLITNLALFILGLSYNLNRQSLGLMDLFQGIAAAAFITYIPFRRKWPSWAIAVIAIEFFLIAFAPNLTLDDTVTSGYIVVSTKEFIQSLNPNYAHADLMGKYLTMMTQILDIPLWKRFLFVHFSVLPWTGCALLGGLVMRHARSRSESFLWLLFIGALLASLTFPFFQARHAVDYFFRGRPDYVLRHVGIAGIIVLGLRRAYVGRGKWPKWVEFVGRESLLIFIAQWVLIEFLTIFIRPRVSIISLLLFTALIYWLMTMIVRFFAKRRDKGIDSMSYVKKWFGIQISFSIIAAVLHFGIDMPGHTNINLAHLFSFVSAIAFAMAFPSLKTVLKKNPRARQSMESKPLPKR